MPQLSANGLKIEYEETGDPGSPAILLIMGLGAQLVMWPLDYVKALAEAGFRVIQFDNRDIGLSQKLHTQRARHPLLLVLASRLGIRGLAPYTLLDMVDDTEGVMDALDIHRAHIIGASMGGMIAQLTAATKPARVKSLTSIMSTTGNPNLPQAKRSVVGPLFLNRVPPKHRDQMIDHAMAMWKIIGTPDPDADPDYLRSRVVAAIDRSYYPAGVRRQMSAIMATGDFRPYLKDITAPTLVIHGSKDPLAPVEGGKDSAQNIPSARLEIIEGMAHDLPRKHLQNITDLTVNHIRQAENQPTAATV